jgi:hypothetical protein
MPNLSRRHLVTAAAALPALAMPAAVLPVAALAKPIAAPAELDPVIELAERTIKTWDEFGAAITAVSPLEELKFDWRRKNPPPEQEAADVVVEQSRDAAGYLICNVRCEPSGQIEQKKIAHNRAYRNWERRKARFAKRCGYSAAYAKQCEVHDAHSAVRDQLEETQPRTWAGFVAKARAARHLDQDEALCQQIAVDIATMAGEVKPVAVQS